MIYDGTELTVKISDNMTKGIKKGSLIGIRVPGNTKQLLVLQIETTEIKEKEEKVRCVGKAYWLSAPINPHTSIVRPAISHDVNIPKSMNILDMFWMKGEFRAAFINGSRRLS
jgi:hypothetical protein